MSGNRTGTKGRRPTIADVARKAGYSETTVSLVLNGKAAESRISEKARQRILETCREINYAPSFYARHLAQGRSRTLAFLLPPNDGGRVLHLFGGVLAGVLKGTNETDLRLYLSEVPLDRPAQEHLRWASEGSIDGALGWGVRADQVQEEKLRAYNVPIVYMDSYGAQETDLSVMSDHANGSEQAVAHLAELGHRRLVFVQGPETSYTSGQRRQGFVSAVTRRFPDQPVRILSGGFTKESGYHAGRAYLETFRDATAIVCANDYSAYGLIQLLQDEGVRVPADVSVIGATDTELAGLVQPGLTSVRVRMNEIGREAVHLMARVLEGDSGPTESKTLPVELIVRETTTPPRA